jgi:phosphoglycolate phosphatase-like HAD superfamily hydrolase
LNNEYHTLHSKTVYIRRDCYRKFPNINAIIFDCDGVLIDVRNSYTETIVATINHVSEEMLGIKLPHSTLSKLIHQFKMSGGFNNEWDITYAVLLLLFTMMPIALQPEFIDQVHQTTNLPLYPRYQSLASTLSGHTGNKPYNVQSATKELFNLANQADTSGIHSIQDSIKTPETRQIFNASKNFLNYPGPVGKSLITTIFEEIFCGPSLFETTYQQIPQFISSSGLIAQEKIIINDEILDNLTYSIGRSCFGIATGRPYQLTKCSLGPLLDRFQKDTIIFLDNVLQAEQDQNVSPLTKPHPFSLLQSAQGFPDLNLALYVGDSAEDIIMVNDARKERDQFLSVGVYSTSNYQDDLITTFINLKTDIILPSIRELSPILNQFKVKK